MLRFTVKIYEYTTGEAFEVVVGGYNHGGSTSWINTTAYTISDPTSDRDFKVRFGHDGTKCCVYIGELASTWSYPQVTVTDFQGGFNGATTANWADGWDISVVTSFGTITRTETQNEISTQHRLVRVGGTTVIDSSRNLTNIGTIASGNINTTTYVKTPSVGMGAGAYVGTAISHTAAYREGLFWHTDTGYSIARTAGAWSDPDYQQLKIDWPTGIELDGGTAYGKSGVNISAGDLKIGGTTVIAANRNLTNIGSISSSSDVSLDNSINWHTSATDRSHQRADARNSGDALTHSRLHWYGVTHAQATGNFRHAWYDGANYINVTASSGTVTFDGNISSQAIATTGAVTIDVDNQENGALRILANQTNPEQDYYFAQEIQSTLSGSTVTTADREQGGIHLDINSTATGGDTANEHRVYGIYADVDSTGDADAVVGGYFNATATPSTGTTTTVSGVSGYAEDNGGAGLTATIQGVEGIAWSDNATSDANTLVGGKFKAGNSTDSGAIGVARGVTAEIEINGTGDLVGTSYVFDAQYDNNTGVAQTHTAALYYGNYAGTLPTNAYGVYIADSVVNYFAGFVRSPQGFQIGTTTVIDSSRNLTNIGTISSGAITSGAITSVSPIGATDNVRTGLTHDDSTAMAAGVGGQLVLGYKYTSAGDYTEGAIIKMYKLNATSGNYSSGLKFQVRETGVSLSTKMELDPAGNLDVTGALKIGSTEVISSGRNGGFALLQGTGIGVNNSSSTTKKGIALYGGSASSTNPIYGLMFSGTANSGTHGSVTGDWATYFTMNSSSGRGWIFRNVSTPTNVASISNAGAANFNSSVTSGILVANILDPNNPEAVADTLRLSGYGLMANRGTVYITNSNTSGVIQLGVGGVHNANPALTVGAAAINAHGSTFQSGAITSSGNVTAYSDERLKDDIETLDGKKVLEMRGVSFTKDGESGSGVIAQELEKIAPELVHTADDEMGTKSVAYGNLVGYLIEAVKTQQQQIEDLSSEIKKLKEK